MLTSKVPNPTTCTLCSFFNSSVTTSIKAFKAFSESFFDNSAWSAIAAISSVLLMDCSSSYLHLEFTISILFIQSQRPYPSYGMPLCTVIPVFTVNVKVNPPFPLYFQAFSLFYHTFKVQIQILLLKTFFSLLSALSQSEAFLCFLPISMLYLYNNTNWPFSRIFPDRSDGSSDIPFRPP